MGLDYLLKKLRETGTAERMIGSGRRRSSRTTQNIDAVEDLRRETPDFISPDLWPSKQFRSQSRSGLSCSVVYTRQK